MRASIFALLAGTILLSSTQSYADCLVKGISISGDETIDEAFLDKLSKKGYTILETLEENEWGDLEDSTVEDGYYIKLSEVPGQSRVQLQEGESFDKANILVKGVTLTSVALAQSLAGATRTSQVSKYESQDFSSVTLKKTDEEVRFKSFLSRPLKGWGLSNIPDCSEIQSDV